MLERGQLVKCKQSLQKGLTAAIVLSVNTFLKRKQKAYIYHIYFEIATFLKTGVYINNSDY